MVNTPSWAACSLSHNISYPASLRVKRQFTHSHYAFDSHYHEGGLFSLMPPQERQEPQDHRADPYRRCSPYSVPVLLKRLADVARDSGSRGCGWALATRAGGLRKTANFIHPPPTSSSNAPRSEKRSGRGAVRSGACRAKRTPAHLGSAPEPHTPKPNRMKPAE
jgi:hypothetical protein